MKYPKLSPLPTSRETVDVFRGYRHGLRIGKGECSEMTNLTSDHYPILSPRAPRGVFASPAVPQGMIAKDVLCYVDGGDFIMGETRVAMGLTADGNPKHLVSMGAHVIVLPDKKYINTADPSDHGPIEAIVQTASEVTFSLCAADGTVYETVIAQDGEPEDVWSGTCWLDTSQKPHVLYRYEGTTGAWLTVSPIYVRIDAPGIGLPFSEGDGVRIADVVLSSADSINGVSVIEKKGDSFIVVRGVVKGTGKQTAPVTVSRSVPDMDFVIESENRLWGCRYGKDGDGHAVNAIYACKEGDFRNWQCVTGKYTDSFCASVGTDGAFTGAVTHLGYPLFFKEHCVHKIYGGNASNYRVQTTVLRGVQKGCSRSLAVVGETLYYKSRTGVCSYDGSLPTEISDALGDIAYTNAAAGALGRKYYISMADERGDDHLFVYDTARKLWHREDGTQATEFCAHGGELYYIDYATNQIRTVKGTGVKESAPIRWSATSGIIGTDSPDKKYISRMDVRMQLGAGARVSFFAEYDSSGEYEYLFTMTGKSLQSFSVPIRPRRCDHLRLRAVGTGDAKIFSVCKTVEWGNAT